MKQSVLIIDDSVVNINTLNLILKEDYRIYVSKNGKDGIEQAISLQPSIILLDIVMPEMDGFQVLEILSKNPLIENTPIMIISSLSDEKKEERGLQLGAVDYITKPFNPSVIKAKVKNHIELFLYRKTIENIAMLDGLTGIPNRRSYDFQVQSWWRQAQKEKKNISIAILDIDCFKEYNDNYGHMQGDIVLKRVAKKLEESLPSTNAYVARYGGEEFAVILYDYLEEQAIHILENVRNAIEEMKIPHIHSRAKKVITVSIGGKTLIPEEQDELQQFVEAVDRRLYRAKGRGRDNVIWDSNQDSKGQIEVFFFGGIKILSHEGSLVVNTKVKKKIWILFVYLISNRFNNYTKQELVNAVWPYGGVNDQSFELKRLIDALKVELEVLKLPFSRDIIVNINGVYHWNNNYMCIVDSELFENLCMQAEKEEQDEVEIMKLYKNAVELYKQDYLYRITCMDWINQKQKQYRKMYLDALVYILKRLYYRHDFGQIVSYCERVIESEEFNEKLQYYYLIALNGLGRKKEAIDHYEYIVESYYSVLNCSAPRIISDLYLELVNPNVLTKKNIRMIREEIKEAEITYGAYYCDYHVFKNIYQLEARNMIRTGKIAYLCLLNLEVKATCSNVGETLLQAMNKVLGILKENLRIGDTISKLSDSQYILLIPLLNHESGNRVMKRILSSYEQEANHNNVKISYDLLPVEATELGEN